MHGINTFIPDTNHVPTEHCVAAILVLLFMVLISLVRALTPLYLYVSTFQSMCAVPNMAVFCSLLLLLLLLLLFVVTSQCHYYVIDYCVTLQLTIQRMCHLYLCNYTGL